MYPPSPSRQNKDVVFKLQTPSRRARLPHFPRFWNYIWITTVSILFVLLFSVTRHARLTSPTVLQEQEKKKVFYAPPVLGSEENPQQLYFPSNGTDFQPQLARYNEVSLPQGRPRTPLFIGFTRNNDMMRQTVLSYIAAGWPREDIIIVDNSGTLDANNEGLLSHDNPFFLDYNLFRDRYGVSILQTPTFFNFAQLMNFYLRTSMAHSWPYFFWSHMDVVVLSNETVVPYKSFYEHVLDVVPRQEINSTSEANSTSTETRRSHNWAVKFFAYDFLTLVNVEAWRSIGQWDTFLPFYFSDCDAYSRAVLKGFTKEHVDAGRIFDVAGMIEDPESRLFPGAARDTDLLPNSSRYRKLHKRLVQLESAKKKNAGGRNTWQTAKEGGRGEPWTYDPRGFHRMWWLTAEHGRSLYRTKWKHTDCKLDQDNVPLSDMWKSEWLGGRI